MAVKRIVAKIAAASSAMIAIAVCAIAHTKIIFRDYFQSAASPQECRHHLAGGELWQEKL